MNAKFPVLLALFLAACAPTTNAAIYQGVITGIASTDEFSSAPFNNGDPFTLTLLVNTTGLVDLNPSVNEGFYQGGNSNLQLLLNIGGYTGTFGSFFIQTQNNMSGTTDSFSINMNLDEPTNVFNGSPDATLAFAFYGPTNVLLNDSLAQSFNFTDFDPGNIAFYAGYTASLQMTTGTYGPVVPIPSTLFLFTPALAGLVAVARRKKK